jgi:hypothetical protein
MTQNKARRTNKIVFLQLPWAQEVRGSNPRAPTTYFFVFNSLLLMPLASEPLAGARRRLRPVLMTARLRGQFRVYPHGRGDFDRSRSPAATGNSSDWRSVQFHGAHTFSVACSV